MQRFKDILVGVALDDYDAAVLDYAALVAFMSHADRVRFLHVRPEPLAMGGLYQEYITTFDESATEAWQRLQEVVAQHYHGPSNADAEPALRDGNPLAELLRMTRAEDVDLVVVGKDHNGGALAEKLARKAPCSVLIVPDALPERTERVLVPVDFSDHAADAVDVAAGFADAAGLAELHVLHVYPAPPAKLDSEQARADLDARARRYLDEFLDGLDLGGLHAVGHLACSGDVHAAIDSQTELLGADLVVIGTRGRTAGAAVLLGSVAERAVRAARVPTVAVKRKGATLSLLDALFKL